MHRERSQSHREGGLGVRGSRRQFIENVAIIGGGLAVAASGVDAIGSADYVFGQVYEEIPPMLSERGITAMKNTVARFSKIPNRTPDQQQAADSAQTLLTLNEVNEEARTQRADQLQQEADETPVLGTTRNSLRWGAAEVGGAAIALGVISKVFRIAR